MINVIAWKVAVNLLLQFVVEPGIKGCYASFRLCTGCKFSNLELALLRQVVGGTEHRILTSRLQVLVAPPQHITQFIIRQVFTLKAFQTYLFEHLQEEVLYPLPPARLLGVLEVRPFSQTCHVLLRGGTLVAVIPVRVLVYDTADFRIRRVIHIVEECFEVFSKQFAQPVMRHRFVQKRYNGISLIGTIAYVYRNAPCASLEHTFGSLASARTTPCGFVDNVHVVQVQPTRHVFHCTSHLLFACLFGVFACLFGVFPGFFLGAYFIFGLYAQSLRQQRVALRRFIAHNALVKRFFDLPGIVLQPVDFRQEGFHGFNIVTGYSQIHAYGQVFFTLFILVVRKFHGLLRLSVVFGLRMVAAPHFPLHAVFLETHIAASCACFVHIGLYAFCLQVSCQCVVGRGRLPYKLYLSSVAQFLAAANPV